MKTTQEQRRNLRLSAGIIAKAKKSMLAPLTLNLLDDFDELQAEIEQLRLKLGSLYESANDLVDYYTNSNREGDDEPDINSIMESLERDLAEAFELVGEQPCQK